MKIVDRVIGPRRSLKRGLLLNILAALSFCILLAGAVIIKEFYEHLKENIEEALTDEAYEIVSQIDPSRAGFGLDSSALRFRGIEGNYRYTVFDASGAIIAGGETSDAIWRQLAIIALGHPQPVALPGDRMGVGLRARVVDHEVLILVSTFPKGNNETRFASLLHELEEEIWWVVLGLLVVLASALFATRQALSPLRALSDQAHQIGPSAAGRRLSVAQVPAEIAPLIGDVNKAFDRLEQGYQAQRDFSANVAHEIRTPIAVLRSSIDRISDPELTETLTQDVDQLDRIFGQLIDLSRADAALKTGFELVDLRSVAVQVATDLAQTALRSGRSLSVTGEDQVLIEGNAGLLAIGLSNVVRNALQYTPETSEVEIEVLADPAGWRVLDRGAGVPDNLKTALFERFNRGTLANSNNTGSGIGLAIVKSVAESHNATTVIEDREGGGTVFSFIFNHPS
ncbi:sensor histidine kinase [Pseudophaeobacter arcticus]|uniref:sensor histidine kinase n=1 Tax=Pseudophaeobacter arcticus TaxID=385492 RepID=UPI003A985D2E